MLTRDQQYAVTIMKQAEAVKDKYKNARDAKKYGVTCHKLPILIHTAGLAQALAFVDSRPKSKDNTKVSPYHQLLVDLGTLICEQTDKQKFLEKVYSAELPEYILLTQKILAALLWYKRFAQSILGVETGEEVEEDGQA